MMPLGRYELAERVSSKCAVKPRPSRFPCGAVSVESRSTHTDPPVHPVLLTPNHFPPATNSTRSTMSC